MSFHPVDSLTPAQQGELVALYQDLWWSEGRSPGDVARVLAGSLVVAFEDGDGRLAAFARVITDGVYKALVLDVVVAPRWRGHGLGRDLLDALLARPEISRVQHVELYCEPAMKPFYEKWGFAEVGNGIAFMRRIGR